jgi:hypothetical protein
MLRPQGHFKPARRRNFWNSAAFMIAINCTIALMLIGLVIASPPAARWISESVQAELAGIALPEAAPTQVAQPTQQTQTARNDR